MDRGVNLVINEMVKLQHVHDARRSPSPQTTRQFFRHRVGCDLALECQQGVTDVEFRLLRTLQNTGEAIMHTGHDLLTKVEQLVVTE